MDKPHIVRATSSEEEPHVISIDSVYYEGQIQNVMTRGSVYCANEIYMRATGVYCED